MLSRRIVQLTLCLFLLNLIGCGGGGTSANGTATAGTAQPSDGVALTRPMEATIVLLSQLERRLPSYISHVKLSAFNSEENLVYESSERVKQSRLEFERVPITATRVVIEYLVDGNLLGVASVQVFLNQDQVYEILNPDFIDTGRDIIGLQVRPSDVEVPKGRSQQFTATLTLRGGPILDVSTYARWRSELPVSPSGLVETSTLGRYTVEASFAGRSESATVLVTEAVLTGVELSVDQNTVPEGVLVSPTVIGIYSDNSRADITRLVDLSSSQSSVLSPEGQVFRALSVGTAELTAAYEGFESVVKVTVTEAEISSIEIEGADQLYLKPGDTASLVLTAFFTNGSTTSVDANNWTSTSPTVLNVNEAGVVQAVQAGDAAISANYLTFQDSVSVRVYFALPPTIDSVVFSSPIINSAGMTAETTDPQGLPLSIDWTVGGVPEAEGDAANPYDWVWDVLGHPGRYQVNVLVANAIGLSTSVNATIEVEGADPWPNEGRDLQKKRQTPYSPSSSVRFLKSIELPGGYSYSTPVVDRNGTVFISSQSSDQAYLNIVNPSTDQVVTIQLPGTTVFSSAAVAPDGTVYIGSEDQNRYESYLNVLQPGATELESYPLPGIRTRSAPVIGADGSVYIGSYAGQAYLSRFEPSTQQLTSLSIRSPGSSDSDPAIAPNGEVYISCFGSPVATLHKVDPLLQSSVSYDLLGHVSIGPAPSIADDGTVYVGSEGNGAHGYLNVLRHGSDEVIHVELPGPIQHGLSARSGQAIGRNGTVYIPTYTNAGDTFLAQVNPNTLSVTNLILNTRWAIRVPPVIVGDDRILQAHYDIPRAYLSVFNPATNALSDIQLAGTIVQGSAAVDSDGTIYISSFDLSKSYLNVLR